MGRRGGMTEGRPELEKTVGLEAPVGGGVTTQITRG